MRHTVEKGGQGAIEQSIFFIPITTLTFVASPYCRFKLDAFLAREAELGRDDLVFPILYIDVPALRDDTHRRNDAGIKRGLSGRGPIFHSFRQANPTRPSSPRDASACFNPKMAVVAVAELFARCISRSRPFNAGSLSLTVHLHVKISASRCVIIRIGVLSPGRLASNCCSREKDIRPPMYFVS